MKKFFKGLICLTLISMLALGLFACGGGSAEDEALEKIKGTWSVESINDVALADFAASVNTTAEQQDIVLVIDNLETVKMTKGGQDINAKIKIADGGFELLDDNGGVFMSVKHDAENDKLSYTVETEQGAFVYVFARQG